jgi:hypothetical protein
MKNLTILTILSMPCLFWLYIFNANLAYLTEIYNKYIYADSSNKK